MVNWELTRQLRQIRRLIDLTTEATSGDIELQSHWARYLCVLLAGFLENAIVEIYGDFAKSAASEPVTRFANVSLRRIQNPNADRFVQTASSFNDPWGATLSAFLDENGRRDAIDSIMANRHHIAHGRYSGITIARVKSFLDRSLEVLEFVEKQCMGR